VDVVKGYLSVKPEEDAVAEVESDIADLEAEDLQATGRTLAEWYADRQALQGKLGQAKQALAAARAAVVAPLKDTTARLEAAAQAFAATDPAKDIGAKIAPW
jgi:hypothetical protein